MDIQESESETQTTSLPEEKEDEEMTSSEVDQAHELYSGQRIISEIIKQNKTTCWPFMDRVDTVGLGLWDYDTRIKEPMWLNKILEKFEKSEYQSFAEFARDFRLMVENCYRYNTTDHPISKKAKRLEMFFESKLALLSKNIREKSTVAKTSNGRFATTIDGRSSSSRSSRSVLATSVDGREHYNPSEFSSQPRLVYDFVRCEEAIVADDEKLANHRERKQQQALYQQVAAAFVCSLERREEIKEIKVCHHLPEIGLFLYLNETVLRLPELAMYNLEMGLMMPSDSLYLARIMTSFLSTYYERNLISHRPPMHFKTWERRLKQRLRKWFEVAEKHKSFSVAAEKLFLCLDFFQSFDWKNPFVGAEGTDKSFLDFSYTEKAHVLKALCDSMTSFQAVQHNVAGLPSEQSRAMTLGEDAAGNVYVYFPQFCGDDVRIYRHRQYGDWTFIEHPVPNEPNGKAPPPAKDPDPGPQGATESDFAESKGDDLHCDADKRDDAISDATVFDQKKANDKLKLGLNGYVEKIGSDLEERAERASEPDAKCKSEPREPPVLRLNGHAGSEPKCDADVPDDDSRDTDTTSVIDSQSSEPGSLSIGHDVASSANGSDAGGTESNGDAASESSAACRRSGRKRKLNAMYKTSADAPTKSSRKRQSARKPPCDDTASAVRRSSRKRAAVDYTKMMVEGEEPEAAKSNPVTPRKGPGRKPSKQYKKRVVQVEEPVTGFGNIDFELVCDSVDSIRVLLSSIEEEHNNAVEVKKSPVIVQNVAALLDRLKWLLHELEPWESRLEKARFDAKIRLKKEHDEILRAATTGNANHVTRSLLDPWEEELLSKNTVVSGGENWSSAHRDHHVPNPLYVEESDEDSERELRRSRRRKPRKYDEDEDYICFSSDESLPPTSSVQFAFDESDEGWKQLLPAALCELESALEAQMTSLHKLLAKQGYDDAFDANGLGGSERRTRQKSKRETKVFRKILYLASRHAEHPSLLPLIRTDQAEINEVVDRLLAKEAVAKQQRKLAREQEERRRRLVKQAVQQQRKNKGADKKTPPEPTTAARDEAEKLPGPRWGRKNTIQPITSFGASSQPAPASASKMDTAENVMVRLQNGRVCQALRFADGRVAPIVRVDGAKPAASFDDLVTSYGGKPKPAGNEVPYISLSGSRPRTPSILRRSSIKNEAKVPALDPPDKTACATAPEISRVQEPPTSQEIAAKRPIVTHASFAPPVSSCLEFSKHIQPPTTVKQKVTLPSGQVINLVVPLPAQKTPLSVAKSTSPVRAMNKFVVRVSKPASAPAQDSAVTVAVPKAPGLTVSVAPASSQPGLVRVVQTPSLAHGYQTKATHFVRPPYAPSAGAIPSSSAQPPLSISPPQLPREVPANPGRGCEQQSPRLGQAIFNHPSGFSVANPTQFNRQPVTYMAPAGSTSAQQLHLVHAVMTTGVPVQFVPQPVIPVQVQAPMMLVNQGQAIHVPIAPANGAHAMLPTPVLGQSAATEKTPPRQFVFKPYSPEK